jgi:hypothetical protein
MIGVVRPCGVFLEVVVCRSLPMAGCFSLPIYGGINSKAGELRVSERSYSPIWARLVFAGLSLP